MIMSQVFQNNESITFIQKQTVKRSDGCSGTTMTRLQDLSSDFRGKKRGLTDMSLVGRKLVFEVSWTSEDANGTAVSKRLEL